MKFFNQFKLENPKFKKTIIIIIGQLVQVKRFVLATNLFLYISNQKRKMRKQSIRKNNSKHLTFASLICFLEVIYSISLIGSLFLVSYTIQAAANPNESLVMFYQLVILPDVYSLPT